MVPAGSRVVLHVQGGVDELRGTFSGLTVRSAFFLREIFYSEFIYLFLSKYIFPIYVGL